MGIINDPLNGAQGETLILPPVGHPEYGKSFAPAQQGGSTAVSNKEGLSPKQATHREEMLGLAKEIPKAPQDRIMTWIEKFNAKVEEQVARMKAGEEIDFDALAQDCHILMMLNLGRDRADEKKMEELALTTITIRRDQILNTHNTRGQLAVSFATGSLQIISGIGGVCAYGAANFGVQLATAQAAAKSFSHLGKVGNGFQGLGTYFQEQNSGQREYFQVNLQILQNKEGQNRNDSQASQSKLEQEMQEARKVREAVNQLLLALFRN